MKKFFGALISVLMMAQAAFVPAMAQDTAITAEAAEADVVLVLDEAQINGKTIEIPTVEPEESEETSVSREEAEVIFSFSDVMCAPGEVISVVLSIESAVKVNSIALSGLKYDESRLEFLGFDNFGPVMMSSLFGDSSIDPGKNTIVLAYMSSSKLNGLICSLKFKVKDDAGYGMTKVSMDAIVKETATDIVPYIDPAVIAPGKVDFAFGEAVYNADGTISVPLSVDTTVPVNSIGMRDLVYDKSLLTFVGFSDFGSLVQNSLFQGSGFDAEKQTITIGYTNSAPVSGPICNLVFAVNEGASFGVTEIGMTSIVRNNSDTIYSTVASSTAVIGKVDLALGTAKCSADGYVEIPVNVVAATVPADSITLNSLTYDTQALTLEGCYLNGTKLTAVGGEYTIALDGKTVPAGTLCTLKFKVNESAAGGLYEVGASASAAKNGMVFASTVAGGVAAIGKTEVTLGSAEGKAGDTVYIDFAVNSTAPIDKLYVEFTFDQAISFEGFYGDVAFEQYATDASNHRALEFVFDNAQTLSGVIGQLAFKIDETAKDATIAVSLDVVVATNSGVAFDSSREGGSVIIKNRLLGDIDGDDALDIRDVLHLFRHAMLPDMYPINYPGTIDYNRDGIVNILDVLSLFRFVMLPDMYPIFW